MLFLFILSESPPLIYGGQRSPAMTRPLQHCGTVIIRGH